MKPIIIIEDDRDGWVLLRDMLIEIGYNRDLLKHCQSIADMQAIDNDDAAFILTDLTLPDSQPDATFEKVCRKFPHVPIIVISGNTEIDVAIKTIKQGAQDYLLKGEIDKRILSKAIQYAVERKRHDNDNQLLFQHNPVPIYIFSKETHQFMAANQAALRQYGYTKDEFLGMTAFDIRPGSTTKAFREHISIGRPAFYDAGKWLHQKKDGTAFYVHIHAQDVTFNGQKARMVVAVDVDKAMHAELALAKKVKEVEYILDSMTDAFCLINEDEEFTYVNRKFEEILNIRRDYIVGKKVWVEFPQAVGLRFYSAYYEAIKQQHEVFFEEFLPGIGKWLSVKVYPLKKGLAIYFVDITQYKEAQERLKLEQQNLSAIINNTSDIIWSIDRSYQIISANEVFWSRLRQLTGKNREDIKVADFKEGALKLWKAYFDRAFAGETYKIVFEEKVDSAIKYAEVRFNPIRNADGTITGASCFSRDITTEREMQKKIIADELNLRAMIDNTEDTIWSVDQDLKLITANQAYLDAVYDVTKKIPQPGQPVFEDGETEEQYPEWKDYYLRGLSGQRFVIERETSFGRQVRHTETRFNPIFDIAGNVVGVSCYSRNITDLKNYLKYIGRQNRELKEIAWMQSHKVRSHVATILGLTDIIRYNDPLSEANAEVLQGIRQSAEDLDIVIREINDKINGIGQ